MLETWAFWVFILTWFTALKKKLYFNYRLQEHRCEILGFSTKNPRCMVISVPKCTLMKFTFLKSSWKVVRNINHPAKSDEIFLKVGTPTLFVLIKCYRPKIHYLMNEESGSEKAIDNADGQFYLKNRFGSRAVLVQLLAKCILLKKRWPWLAAPNVALSPKSGCLQICKAQTLETYYNW